ncbi:hypothetical protein [Actinoplanes sp. NPDC051411]|uniref:hypothetical protein n=1 Tax=Actinoplanes sp. NPDC051411 TaxID=3155522 RepID=UPI00342367D6
MHQRRLGSGNEILGRAAVALGVFLAAAFREFVLGRLPAGLLDRLDVSIADCEIDRLNELITTANAEFRRRLG